MKKWILAAIAACGLCCVPLLVPAAAGLSVFGLQLFGGPMSLDRIVCSLVPAVVVVLVVAVAIRYWSRRSGKTVCKSPAGTASGTCGCK